MQANTLTIWSVAILTGAATTMIGLALLLRRQEKNASELARRRAMQDRDVAGEESGRPRLLFTLQRAGEIVSQGKASLGLRERLAAAGYHGQSAAAIYLGAKVLLFGADVLLVSLMLIPLHQALGLPSVYMLTAISGGVCFFIPDLAVGMARDRRRQNIRRHLPDAVDLLEICVSSGLGLDQAWNSVAEELLRVSPLLADEMELTNLEISL